MFFIFTKYLVLKLFRSSVVKASRNPVASILTLLPWLSSWLSFILRASHRIRVFPVPALPYTNRQVSRLLSTGIFHLENILYFSSLVIYHSKGAEILCREYWNVVRWLKFFAFYTALVWAKDVPILFRSTSWTESSHARGFLVMILRSWLMIILLKKPHTLSNMARSPLML